MNECYSLIEKNAISIYMLFNLIYIHSIATLTLIGPLMIHKSNLYNFKSHSLATVRIVIRVDIFLRVYKICI